MKILGWTTQNWISGSNKTKSKLFVLSSKNLIFAIQFYLQNDEFELKNVNVVSKWCIWLGKGRI